MVEELEDDQSKDLSIPQTPIKRKASKDITPSKKVRRKLMFEEKEKNEVTDANSLSTVREELEKSFEADRQKCIKLYNFDPLTELPLPGKFTWEKVEQNTGDRNCQS